MISSQFLYLSGMAFNFVGPKTGYALTDIHDRMYDPFLEKIVRTQF